MTAPGAPITGISLVFERWGTDKERVDYLHERYHRGLQMVLGFGQDDIFALESASASGSSVVLKIPAGPLSVIESVNNAGQNYLFWRTMAQDGDLEVEGPYRVFHN